MNRNLTIGMKLEFYKNHFGKSYQPILNIISNHLCGYLQPSSQHFGVDMNINYVVIFINFLFTKL